MRCLKLQYGYESQIMKTILRSSIMIHLLGWLIWAYMALCSRTIRWTIIGSEQAGSVWQTHPSMIIAAWHSTILLLPSGWNRVIRRWPNQKPRNAMLISLSQDGEPVAQAIRHLGLEAVRGSSTHKRKKRDKGGQRALIETLRLLRSGGVLCITPDGPRGPAEIVQNGPIIMAQRTGAPIIPYAIVSTPEKRLQTWDKFRIPLPFTRGVIVFGKPVYASPDTDRECLRLKLERHLKTAMSQAESGLKNKHPRHDAHN